MTLKSEIKISILNDQGAKIEDQLEAASKRQSTYDGAKQALRLIAKNITGLLQLADKDLEEGKLLFESPLAALAYIKTMVDRAANMAASAAHHQENLQISVNGEITAYKLLMDGFKKEIASERAKIAAIENALKSGQVVLEDDDSPGSPPRAIGMHPGAGIAAQRRAENAEQDAEAAPEPLETSEDDVAQKKTKKRR